MVLAAPISCCASLQGNPPAEERVLAQCGHPNAGKHHMIHASVAASIFPPPLSSALSTLPPAAKPRLQQPQKWTLSTDLQKSVPDCYLCAALSAPARHSKMGPSDTWRARR